MQKLVDWVGGTLASGLVWMGVLTGVAATLVIYALCADAWEPAAIGLLVGLVATEVGALGDLYDDLPE